MIFQQLSTALGVISLIGFFASSGKQKKISAFLLGMSLLLGIISFTALSPYPQPPSGQSESQQQQLAPQEQVQGTIPTPRPWDSTQFSHRGGILLDKPSQEVNVPENSELCVSELINPLIKGNLQQKVFVADESFSSRMSQYWDIAKGRYAIRIGDTDSAEIKQYTDYKGRVPVIRPK